jgi:hypothetical protein
MKIRAVAVNLQAFLTSTVMGVVDFVHWPFYPRGKSLLPIGPSDNGPYRRQIINLPTHAERRFSALILKIKNVEFLRFIFIQLRFNDTVNIPYYTASNGRLDGVRVGGERGR